MKYDAYGRSFTDVKELCDLLYAKPDLELTRFLVDDPDEFNLSRLQLHAEMPMLNKYRALEESVEWFDQQWQSNWRMPDEYKELDIAAYVLGLCNADHELQRVAEELLLYQERDLFDLLRYLKYLVDTLRKNNLVWGVGRGSSVASYVLFLLGVHKINSIYYDLNVNEFLK